MRRNTLLHFATLCAQKVFLHKINVKNIRKGRAITQQQMREQARRVDPLENWIGGKIGVEWHRFEDGA
jgi:hypothetical protein